MEKRIVKIEKTSEISKFRSFVTFFNEPAEFVGMVESKDDYRFVFLVKKQNDEIDRFAITNEHGYTNHPLNDKPLIYILEEKVEHWANLYKSKIGQDARSVFTFGPTFRNYRDANAFHEEMKKKERAPWSMKVNLGMPHVSSYSDLIHLGVFKIYEEYV